MISDSTPDIGVTWPVRSAETELLQEGISVWRVDLDIAPSLQERLIRLLDPAEVARAGRFRFERDRRRFVASHAALRLILGDLLAIRPAQIAYTYGPYGKPALAGDEAQPDMTFNMAHSEEVALIAVGHGGLLGVDVEYVRPLPDALDVASHYFSPSEIQRLRSVVGTAQEERSFFNCWTRKEAIIKALGTGLSHPLDSFSVTLVPGETAAVIEDATPDKALIGWYLADLQPPGPYAAALATDTTPSAVTTWSWPWLPAG